MNKIMYIKIFLLISFLPVFSQNPTAFSSLSWPLDPVTIGSGEGGAALHSSTQAFDLNPAHIQALQSWQLSFYNRSLQSISQGFQDPHFLALNSAYRFDDVNLIGIHFQNLVIMTSKKGPTVITEKGPTF